MDFQIPLHFEDLAISAPSSNPYSIDVTNYAHLHSDEIIASLSNQSESHPWWQCSYHPSSNHEISTTFHYSYVLVYRFPKLNLTQRSETVLLISNGVTTLLNHISNDTRMANDLTTLRRIFKNPLRISAFMLASLLTSAEKTHIESNSSDSLVAKGKKLTKVTEKWTWAKDGRSLVLETFRLLLQHKVAASYLKEEDEAFSLLFRSLLSLMESTEFLKDKTLRDLLYALLKNIIFNHNQQLPIITALIHMLKHHEHLSVAIADAVQVASTPDQHLDERITSKFALDFVRELASISPKELARDASGARYIALCLMEISDRLPECISKNASCLISHLKGDSYSIRSAVLHCLGKVVELQAKSLCDSSQSSLRNKSSQTTFSPKPAVQDNVLKLGKDRDAIFEILFERIYDINSYTRSKALQVFTSLCNEGALPLHHIIRITDLCVDRLEDKTAVVRKSAIQLLTVLLQTNPFGPSLNLDYFTARKEQTRASTERNMSTEQSSQGEALSSFYQIVVDFVTKIEKATIFMHTLLKSKSITDVIEALSFFVTALKFQISGATNSARTMLILILNRENSIKAAAFTAFQQLLFPLRNSKSSSSEWSKEDSLTIARNFLCLTSEATVGHLTCLESLILEFYHQSDNHDIMLTGNVLQVIWDIYIGKVPGTSLTHREGACYIIGVISRTCPDILLRRLHLIEEHILKSSGKNPLLIFNTLQALKKALETQKSNQLVVGQSLIRSIMDTILNNKCSISNQAWIAIAQQAIDLIYMIEEKPENVIRELIFGLSKAFVKEESDTAKTNNVSSVTLSKVIFIIGHVAVKQLVYAEKSISEIRAHLIKMSEIAKKENNNSNTSLESDLGLNATIDEVELDAALHLAEVEITEPFTLLGRFLPLVVGLASDPNVDSTLRILSVSTLSKLMAVDPAVCERHLQLLFSIIKTASEPIIRANGIIALGDLAFRFPNLIEPWSSHLYRGLEDTNPLVRKNTLMTLTHLVLNDMVKVKGHIVGIALCLEDMEAANVDLAKLFFNELSRKSGHLIYNILPDIISCLSHNPTVTSETFTSVMKYLIGFINKERQIEGVIEKLCIRFRATEKVQDWRDLSFCLSLLSYSERSFKKLEELFKTFADKILDDVVYAHFCVIFSKSKKFAKFEFKTRIESFEMRLNLVRKASKEGMDLDQIISKLADGVSNMALEENQTPSKKTSYSGNDENATYNGNSETSYAKTKTNLRQKKKSEIQRKRDCGDGKEDKQVSGDDFYTTPRLKERKKAGRAGRKALTVIESDSESE